MLKGMTSFVKMFEFCFQILIFLGVKIFKIGLWHDSSGKPTAQLVNQGPEFKPQYFQT
jgi:hypothetical protein